MLRIKSTEKNVCIRRNDSHVRDRLLILEVKDPNVEGDISGGERRERENGEIFRAKIGRVVRRGEAR